jgi:PAS domain S-box-containing protein
MSVPPNHDLHYPLLRLVDRVPSMLAYWDAQLRCRFANRAYEAWFGVDRDALIGTTLPDLLGPALYALNRPHIEAALRGEEQLFERMIPGPKGLRHSLARYLPDVVDGAVRGFAVEVTDVTRLKEAEAALRASEAFLDRTGRIAAVGGWELNLVSGQLDWTPQTRRIHEVAPEFTPGYDEAIDFFAPAARPTIRAAVEQALDGGPRWDLELPLVTATGREIWVRVMGELERRDGRPLRLVGAIQDVTEQRARRLALAHEQALRLQVERHAEELDRLLTERSEMLDVMAHEVRQPLHNAAAALEGAVAVLGEAGQAMASMRLTRANEVMGQVMASIDNTLAVASLLARPEPIHREDTDIDLLLALVIADMPPGDRGRVRIERLTATRTAAMDLSLMRLALRNLLANALRFSAAEAPVTIQLRDWDEPLALVIDVVDAGIGIREALVSKLFTRGVHRGKRVSSLPQGLGLGLYIVRRVMELHGGRAELLRNTPEGVTIRVVLNQG